MTRRPRPERRRDLQGLLGDEAADLTRAAVPDRHLPVEQITAGQVQPRREFDARSLESLSRSIRDHGVLQPILVRPSGESYEIVAGERRWRAAQMAGLSEVPVVIRELQDAEARRLALIENLQRDDLNTLDEVDAKLELVSQTLNLPLSQVKPRMMQMLRETPGADHMALEDLFGALGEQWTSFARNKLKILNWPTELLNAVRGGLAYTAAQQIAQVDAAHHAHLIVLARAGASRSELQAEISHLREQGRQLTAPHLVARHLGSARWLKSLTPGEQKELDQWIASMPDTLRLKLRQ